MEREIRIFTEGSWLKYQSPGEGKGKWNEAEMSRPLRAFRRTAEATATNAQCLKRDGY